MRVLIAPDSYAGTLSAAEAAAALAAGWHDGAPGDEVVEIPLSDGGPGFLEVLHAVLGGELVAASTTDPLGRPVDGQVLVAGDTAYVESAQACGLHLLAPPERDLFRASTAGVADLLVAAAGTGARRIVVGLGGSGTNDGGRGMLARLDRAAVAGRELVAATDVDNPLLGPAGAAATYGPQKGASRNDVLRLDAALAAFADEIESRDPALAGLRDRPGAGAAGGLGWALLSLGARRVSGVDLVLEVVDLAARVEGSGLAVTGEGSFDFQSLRGKVVSGVAAMAQAVGVPAVVIAGQVAVGRREMAAAGVSAAYSLVEAAGSTEAALSRPAHWAQAVAEKVARQWSVRR